MQTHMIVATSHMAAHEEEGARGVENKARIRDGPSSRHGEEKEREATVDIM